MKILLLGDYSGCHANLAAGLRKLGHSVTLVSDACGFMDITPDVLLERKPGTLGSVRYLLKVIKEMRHWKGYDVVQFINPQFLLLRPEKLKRIFKWLLKHNKSFFVTQCSYDSLMVNSMLNTDLFRYSEAKVGEKPTDFYIQNPIYFDGWLLPVNLDYHKLFFSSCDGLMSINPEYSIGIPSQYANKLFPVGIPIDLSKHTYKPLEIADKVKVLLGYKTIMKKQKGVDEMQRSLRELAAEMPDKMELIEVHDLPFDQYLEKLKEAHIVVDQLYAYSPATNALNAMAMGKVAASGCEPEYAEWIGEENPPVIPLRPTDDVKEVLRGYILDPQRLCSMGEASRRLVEKHNEMTVVAQKFVDAWKVKS